MRVCVDESRQDDRFAKTLDFELRKPLDDFRVWSNTGDMLTVDGDSAVLDRRRRHGNDPTRRINSGHLAGEVC